MRLCTYPNCGRPHRSLGLCDGHRQQRRKGVPLHPITLGARTHVKVLSRRVDYYNVRELEAAALALAAAETDADYVLRRERLIAKALVLIWKSKQSRRAALVSAPSHPAPLPPGSSSRGAAADRETA